MQNELLIFLSENLKEFISYIINILFPPICILCNKIDKNWICEKCYKKLKILMKNKIINYKLTKTFPISKNDKLINIINKPKKINKNTKYNIKILYKLLYIFEYRGIIRKIIIDYKFNDKAYICNFFSNIILNNKFICDNLKRYDIIISVPLSQKRMMQRGYNQTDLIAKNIFKKLNLEYKSDYLIKKKETEKQSSLSKKERKKNIKDAFCFNDKYNIKNKNIILIDDVYTTGNTASECAKILKKNGANEILVLIIAKD